MPEITTLTEETTPDNANDFLILHDVSGSDLNKVKPNSILTIERAATKTLTNTTLTSPVINTPTAEIITSLTAETTIASGDYLMIYDASATALRKMTQANLLAGIGGAASPLTLTASTAAEVPLIIQAATSQTGNLMEFKHSSGLKWLLIDAAGRPTWEDAIITLKYGGDTRGGWHPTQGGWMVAPGYKYCFTDNTNFNTIDVALERDAAGIMEINNGSTGGAALQFLEQTAPAAAATNGARIYAEDNGSGKTRLMVKFQSGAAQQIAIEP
jgi:hypothetical protein